MSKRSRARAGLVLAAALLAACTARKERSISVAQFDALRARLEAQSGPTAPPPDAETPPVAPPAAADDAGALPPRDDAERRARAAAALPPKVELGDVVAVGDGTRWVVALATAPAPASGAARGAPNLLLIDVARPVGLIVGAHDFGDERTSGLGAAGALIGRTLLLDASPREPVILAEVLDSDGDGKRVVGACGWSLARRRWNFVCAPRVTPTSRYDGHRGQLVETWDVDSVGTRLASTAGTRSGRVLRYEAARWVETDSFRCLGRPPSEAFREAGGQPLERWQHDTVRRLTQAAKRASAALETDKAISRLRDALAVDGCSPEAWRVLGRLEFEAGRPEAVATLAVATALAPRDDAVLLDLADALAVLDVRGAAQRESWHTALAVLESRGATRRFAEGRGSTSPQGLAVALYTAFLERTSATDEWLAARRRKVEEKIAALEGARPVQR